MPTTVTATPSNPNWVREVTPSPRMREHLASLRLDRLYEGLTGITLEAGAIRTYRALSILRIEGNKSGVYDTDSQAFRDAVSHYVFLYRVFHPIKAISELPGLLRSGQEN